ncbi:unnamed protein product [Ilex paraguariensis]|uniref:Pentatricopeptide repeat-containing protein n=1 Tax=Ilex paraguariensis TaxID=185542 RepID=A0ABC8SRN3_9AQUA
MQHLPSILRPPKPKSLISLLSYPGPLSPTYSNFSLSLLETHRHPNHFNQILSLAITSALFTDPFVSSKLLHHSLSNSNFSLEFSHTLFFQIQNPNIFAWSFILRAFSQSSVPEEAIVLYNLMRRKNIVPVNMFSLLCLKLAGEYWVLKKA